jgi:hypothetical protein
MLRQPRTMAAVPTLDLMTDPNGAPPPHSRKTIATILFPRRTSRRPPRSPRGSSVFYSLESVTERLRGSQGRNGITQSSARLEVLCTR